MSSLNDLTRTTSCSSFFASKNTDDFLKNFLKNMSILKAGLLKEIHPPKPTKRPSKIETTQEKDDLASISSDNTTSTIGNRLYQKTTRSSLARNFEGSNDVSFEKSLRSSKRMSPSLSARIGCPKENPMLKPKVPNPKKERRKNLKRMINDGFLEKLKSRSELRLDFVKEKPRIFAVLNAKPPIFEKPKSERKTANLLNGSRNSFTSKSNKCRPNLTSCDNRNQKISKNLKLKPSAKNLAGISFDEAFERSLFRKCNSTNLNDSHFKPLNSFLSKRLINAEAKTDEQITKEKQWLDTQKVWLMHRGGFALARKISGPEVEPGKVRIQLEQTGDHLNVDEDDIETRMTQGAGAGKSNDVSGQAPESRMMQVHPSLPPSLEAEVACVAKGLRSRGRPHWGPAWPRGYALGADHLVRAERCALGAPLTCPVSEGSTSLWGPTSLPGRGTAL
ncbi:hypothetical protein QE152_g23026 [Popillia japonica]|uniref:Unconventional myosin-XVIIIa SH3 domain-containing protein n=1 Tax=Popillia japonica TaxID=7064 RepID=A0AAW1KH18_POPJA